MKHQDQAGLAIIIFFGLVIAWMYATAPNPEICKMIRHNSLVIDANIDMQKTFCESGRHPEMCIEIENRLDSLLTAQDSLRNL